MRKVNILATTNFNCNYWYLVGNRQKLKIGLATFIFIILLFFFGTIESWLNLFRISNKRAGHYRSTSEVDDLTETLLQKLNETADMQPMITAGICKEVWYPCRPEVCLWHLSSNPQVRMREILSPKLTLTDEDRRKIEDLSSTVPVSDVIFVSATSDNHYDETQAMVRSLHTAVYPKVKNMTFVLVDIGLTPEQRNKAAMMKARKFVVYQDASISWKDTVLELLDRGDKLGLQLWGSSIMHNIPVATLKGMFDYFGDQPCAYLNYSQIQSGIIVFKQTPFIIRAILEPWAKCGMEKDCFCPNTTHDSVNCNNPIKTIHKCHRFDQSALSMIATKLFTSDRNRYHMPDSDSEDGRYVTINRDQRDPNYFDLIISVLDRMV